MKYEIVSYAKDRGRNNTVFVRAGLAVARGPEEQRPTRQDVVMTIVDGSPESPLWKKDVGEFIEIS